MIAAARRWQRQRTVQNPAYRLARHFSLNFFRGMFFPHECFDIFD
jgi:hypothetical protein